MEWLAFWEMCPQVLFIGTADLYFIDFQLLADTNKILVQFREFILLIIPIRFPKTVTRELIILIIPIRFSRDSHTWVYYSHYSHSFPKRQSHVS